MRTNQYSRRHRESLVVLHYCLHFLQCLPLLLVELTYHGCILTPDCVVRVGLKALECRRHCRNESFSGDEWIWSRYTTGECISIERSVSRNDKEERHGFAFCEILYLHPIRNSERKALSLCLMSQVTCTGRPLQVPAVQCHIVQNLSVQNLPAYCGVIPRPALVLRMTTVYVVLHGGAAM